MVPRKAGFCTRDDSGNLLLLLLQSGEKGGSNPSIFFCHVGMVTCRAVPNSVKWFLGSPEQSRTVHPQVHWMLYHARALLVAPPAGAPGTREVVHNQRSKLRDWDNIQQGPLQTHTGAQSLVPTSLLFPVFQLMLFTAVVDVLARATSQVGLRTANRTLELDEFHY